MKLNFKKRKAETLAESVVAIAVFGILLLGLTDFMSSQINYVARLKHRDKIISKAQELITGKNFFEIIRTADSFKATDSTWPEGIKDLEDIASFDWDKDKKVLTVKDSAEELDFALP